MLIWVVGVAAAVAGILLGIGCGARRPKRKTPHLKRWHRSARRRAVKFARGTGKGSPSPNAIWLARLSGVEAELRNERQNLQEKLALLETAKKTLADQFQALAGEILDKKSKAFSESSQTQLGTLLEPLKTQIKEFREKVEQAQSDSKTGVAKLEGLIGNLGSLNQQLAEEAKNLSSALRGSAKAQGDWGEFILRDLLEKAGLREGEQYSFQQSFTGLESEDGGKTRSARTDVIILLPGGRNLIIDSKVSLTAYTDYANAAADTERSAALKLHLGERARPCDGIWPRPDTSACPASNRRISW